MRVGGPSSATPRAFRFAVQPSHGPIRSRPRRALLPSRDAKKPDHATAQVLWSAAAPVSLLFLRRHHQINPPSHRGQSLRVRRPVSPHHAFQQPALLPPDLRAACRLGRSLRVLAPVVQ